MLYTKYKSQRVKKALKVLSSEYPLFFPVIQLGKDHRCSSGVNPLKCFSLSVHRLPLGASSAGAKKHHHPTDLLRCCVTASPKHLGIYVSLNLRGASQTLDWFRACMDSQIQNRF